MMDKTAIKQIQTLGSMPEIIAQLQAVGFPVAALPDNFKLESLEHLMPNRNQFRGNLTTANIDEFVKYNIEYEQEGTQCFVDATGMSAESIFDLGTANAPGHCVHTSVLQLRRTAAYKALLNINEERQLQKQLAEWVEDYSANLEVYSSDGEVIDPAVASSAIRNMKFEQKRGRESNVEDFSVSQSEYESIAVRTKDEFPMPAVFKFTCEPYLGLSTRVFEMRMSTIGNEVLVLRIKKLEQHIEDMGEEFKDLLLTKFQNENAEFIQTYIGDFRS